jgi:hypothetical protein
LALVPALSAGERVDYVTESTPSKVVVDKVKLVMIVMMVLEMLMNLMMSLSF